MTAFTKRGEDRLDYDVDFSRWLTSDDIIVAATVSIAGGGVVVDEHAFTDTVVKVWLTGGDVGETATVKVEITTTLGRQKEICFKLRVRERC